MSLSYLLFAGKYSIMTSYFANVFLYIFLPASIIGFFVMPKKAKKYFLLAASLIYFWLVAGKLIIYPLLSILAVHYFGLWLDRIRTKQTLALKEAEKEEKKPLQSEKPTTLDDRIDTFFRVLFSQINQKNKGKN